MFKFKCAEYPESFTSKFVLCTQVGSAWQDFLQSSLGSDLICFVTVSTTHRRK
jgi:hypothetical protein